MFFRPYFSFTFFSFSCLLFMLAAPQVALAQGKGALFYTAVDDEANAFLVSLTKPLFKAWPKPETAPKIEFILVKDKTFNSFVMDERHIFINIGLFEQVPDAGTVAAVLSHEMGHIFYHHTVWGGAQNRHMQKTVGIGFVLGAVLGLVIRPEAFLLATFSPSIALSKNAIFSQSQEAAADQFGVRLLHRAGYDPNYLLKVMDLLKSMQEGGAKAYWLSHPPAKWRYNRVKSTIKQFGALAPPSDHLASLSESFFLIRAKVLGYLEDPRTVLRRFSGQKTLPARYAIAIALLRQRKMKASQKILFQLIKEKPQDPWFYEVLAQSFQGMGNYEAASKAYETANKKAKGNARYIKLAWAECLLLSSGKNRYERAEKLIKETIKDKIPGGWRLLVQIYTKRGDKLHLTQARLEESLQMGNIPYAIALAKRLKKLAKKGSPLSMRAEDILVTLGETKAISLWALKQKQKTASQSKSKQK